MTTETTALEQATPTIGTRIAAARSAKGYSVHALSEQLGVNDGVVAAWEADEREPRSNRIQMLAGMLNVSIMWLITGDSNGTDYVEKNYERPEDINAALNEITQLRDALTLALDKLSTLETRLQNFD